MKCARVQLRERMRRSNLNKEPSVEKPRRYCQKRMVNPEHEEDPRWMDALDRFRCQNLEYKPDIPVTQKNKINNKENKEDDLFLTVQNIQFQGNIEERKRPKSCFKYKAVTDGNKHRLFVKEIIDNQNLNEDENLSQISNYYLEDYMTYITNSPSRPTSSKSSIFCEMRSNMKNKATQIEENKCNEPKKNKKIAFQLESGKKETKKAQEVKEDTSDNSSDTKIAFHKSGKRKSLTISRAQSPETVQVIRVDVVCSYSCSSAMSDYEDNKKNEQKIMENERINIKGTFASKYLLTNTRKPLDEKAGGAKVTLMCKTFSLADRRHKTIK